MVPWRGGRRSRVLLRFRLGRLSLSALLAQCALASNSSEPSIDSIVGCNVTSSGWGDATPIYTDLSDPTVTVNGSGMMFWFFRPPADEFRIIVTPESTTMDPDIILWASVDGTSSCKLMDKAQDYGGDVLVVPASKLSLNASFYILEVIVSGANRTLPYHVAFVRGRDPHWEPIHFGDSRSGVAYRGAPVHYTFTCDVECQRKANVDSNQRITVSASPRDAMSAGALMMLVYKGLPGANGTVRFPTTPGWFSGDVASIDAVNATFYVSILLAHGDTPVPFVVTVRMPNTTQRLEPGIPMFGAVNRGQMAFFSFYVSSPNSDIELYLTRLSGDPDIWVSHEAVSTKPTPQAFQWRSLDSGDDELIIPPDDPKRVEHPTGWFYVGIHGYSNSAFSLLALSELHCADGACIKWTELWLGLPQRLSAGPMKPARCLFYSRLETPRLFVNVKVKSGPQPDACMVACGPDPHFCPYISPHTPSDRRDIGVHTSHAISDCAATDMLGEQQQSSATVAAPCTDCWFALLVTSPTNTSAFQVLLGADGWAHLPEGISRPFRGYIGADDASVQELAVNGEPFEDWVPVGQHRRYVIRLGAPAQALTVTLSPESGDSNLFLGLSPNVSENSSELRSEVVGSDSVTVPADGELNTQQCGPEVFTRPPNECYFYVAVLGVSSPDGLMVRYRLSATVPSKGPALLAPATPYAVVVPALGWQALRFPLEAPIHNMSLMVVGSRGPAPEVYCRVVTTSSEALLRGGNAAASQPDFRGIPSGTGGMTAFLDAGKMAQLCEARITASAGGECFMLVGITAHAYFTGEAHLVTEDDNWAEPLDDRVPETGTLRDSASALHFKFWIPEASGDLTVNVLSLSDCRPHLSIEFPAAPRALEFDSLDGVSVHAEVKRTAAEFHAGYARLNVSSEAPQAPQCEFQIVAEMSTVGTGAALTVLRLNEPVLLSGERERLLVFTSRLGPGGAAEARDGLEVVVQELAGDVEVAAFYALDNKPNAADSQSGFTEVVEDPATPEVFILGSFESNCGGAAICQLMLRVRSTPPGRVSDYVVVASDRRSSQATVLVPGLPVVGYVSSSHSASADYLLFVDNPSAELVLELSCAGAGGCKDFAFSADARPKMPARAADRAYQPEEGSSLGDGSKLLHVQPSALAANTAPGACLAPCLLHVRVEVQYAPAEGIRFELLAKAQAAYSILLDGHEPTPFTARRGVPTYFLFDSRRHSPLLTLVLDVPYDAGDPHADLVNMFVLDCAVAGDSGFSQTPGQGVIVGQDGDAVPIGRPLGSRPVDAARLRNASLRPGPEFYTYRGLRNPRGQLVAFIGGGEGNRVDEGAHCWYRIAVVSVRLDSARLALRGLEVGHPDLAAALPLDTPLQGVVDAAHAAEYRIDPPLAWGGSPQRDVSLSLEVCSGRVRLKLHTLQASNGLEPSLVPFPQDQLVEVSLDSTGTAATASFMIAAEDPSWREWLAPQVRDLAASPRSGTEVTLTWAPALIHGSGHLQAGDVDVIGMVEYEVFYGLLEHVQGNTSSPCGLYYEEHGRRAIRRLTKKQRSLTVGALLPGRRYYFNVVARHLEKRFSVAYEPTEHLVPVPADPESSAATDKGGDSGGKDTVGGPIVVEGGSSGSSGQQTDTDVADHLLPLVAVLSIAALLVWFRPCCKPNPQGAWHGNGDFEMGRRRAYVSFDDSRRSRYSPPPMVGEPHSIGARF